MRIKTTPENIAKIEQFAHDIEKLFIGLYSRWQDEKEHEKIEDYAEPVKKFLPERFEIVGMAKRPFSLKFTIGTEAEYAIFVKAAAYGWSRTK